MENMTNTEDECCELEKKYEVVKEQTGKQQNEQQKLSDTFKKNKTS